MVRWRGGGGGYISFLDHHSKGKVIDTGSWVFSREKVDAGMGRRAGACNLVVYQNLANFNSVDKATYVFPETTGAKTSALPVN